MKLNWPFKGKKKQPVNSASSLDSPEEWLVNALLGHASESGIVVTPLKALGVATVYACVNIVSRTMATLPLKVYRRLPGGGKEEALDHPLYDLLHTAPNEEMTSCDWRLATQGHLSLRNNSYSQIIRNRGGDVAEIIPLHPKDVEVFRDSKSKELKYNIEGRQRKKEDVLHFRGFTQNGLKGSDLINICGDVIGLAIALETNAMKFFGNSSRPGLVLEAPNALSDAAFNRLKADLEDKYKGVENAYKAIILEEGMKAARARSENKDSQFDESRDRQDRQIARIFGVPPHKVGVVSSEPRANVEEQNIEYIVDTIGSTVVIHEQAMNMRLLRKEERKEYFISYSIDGLLRGNIKDRYAAYAVGRQWGFLNVDEIRSKENLNPLPDDKGKIYLEPENMREAGSKSEEPPETPNEEDEGDAGIPSNT